MNDNASVPLRRALIIGDSLAAPRPHRGQKLEVTWPALLKRAFPQVDLWQRCRAAAMSDDVLKEFNLFSDSIDAFSLVIVQVGIGDCCPRPYPLWFERFLLAYDFKKVRQRLQSWYPTLLRFRARAWISREEYAANLRAIIETTRARNPGAALCLIRIGPPCAEFVRKVGDSPAAAAAYNRTLENLCASYGPAANVWLLDPYAGHAPEELFIADGHHLTQLGHQLIAQSLAEHVAKLAAPARPAGGPEANSRELARA